MRHAKLIAATTVLAAAATLALAQGTQPIVGLITKTDTNPFFVKMKEGAQAEATKLGAKLLTGAGKSDGDNAGQVTAIENMVAAGAKTILITPSDSKAIVPAIAKARAAGVMVIALDSPTEPLSAVDALFATNNYKAGQLIGQYAKKAMGGKKPVIATLDLFPGQPVGIARHNGFLQGFGTKGINAKTAAQINTGVVCAQDSFGDQAKGQTAMENCLQKNPEINLVYTINEPAAAGAYQALKAIGKEKDVLIVSRGRRLRGHSQRGRRRHRGDQPAVPAQDGRDGRRGGRKLRQDRQESQRLHRHRRQPDHRQGRQRRHEQGHQVRPGQLLGPVNRQGFGLN